MIYQIPNLLFLSSLAVAPSLVLASGQLCTAEDLQHGMQNMLTDLEGLRHGLDVDQLHHIRDLITGPLDDREEAETIIRRFDEAAQTTPSAWSSELDKLKKTMRTLCEAKLKQRLVSDLPEYIHLMGNKFGTFQGTYRAHGLETMGQNFKSWAHCANDQRKIFYKQETTTKAKIEIFNEDTEDALNAKIITFADFKDIVGSINTQLTQTSWVHECGPGKSPEPFQGKVEFSKNQTPPDLRRRLYDLRRSPRLKRFSKDTERRANAP